MTFLERFFNELNAAKINYCVLRNYESLPLTVGDSDLDILVDQEEVDAFYRLLNDVLASLSGKVIIKYGELTPRLCIVCLNDNDWYGLQIDVHEGVLPYKTHNMYPVSAVFSRAKKHNGISVADDHDANIICFFKEILHNLKCSEHVFDSAKTSWQLNSDFYSKALSSVYSYSFIDKLSSTLESHKNDVKITSLAIMARQQLAKGMANKFSNFKNVIQKIYRFKKTPGFCIAFLGTDGSGKTTIINSVTKPLTESVHNAFYYEHMRPNLIPNIAQLFGKKKSTQPVTNPHQQKQSGFVGSILRLLYYFTDYVIGFWLKVYPVTVKKSSIWVFDRYYYDFQIDPKRCKIKLPLWILNLLEYFVPKPDLILCLVADPNVVFERKQEIPLVEVESQVAQLKRFCAKNENAVLIDTGESINTTVNKVMNEIIGNMANRYNG